jgi:hypothetical protein
VEALSSPPELRIPFLSPTRRLVSIPGILLVRAVDGQSPRLATRVRAGWRSGALLVRFDGRDDGWIASKTRRNDALWEEDVFEVFLAREDPPHTYFEFEVNPLGTLFAARIESPGLRRPMICVDVEWNCPGLRARVERHEKSWSAVLRIPFGPLCSDPASIPAAWRANVFRVDRGGKRNPDELSAWSPTLQAPADFHDATRFGLLRLDGASTPAES